VDPLFHRNPRALADLRSQVELIHDPFGPWEPKTKTFSRREAVLQRPIDVGDTRPLIGRNHAYAGPSVLVLGAY
jgi:hypothetical protein